MKWFKSKKQKRIEELEGQVEFLRQLTDDMLASLTDRISEVGAKVMDGNCELRNIRMSAYRIESPRTETLCASVSVPYGVPMTTEDIELRLAERLAEGVAKYMIVSKDNFMKDPLADPTYKAMVKVVPFPVGERRFYEI